MEKEETSGQEEFHQEKSSTGMDLNVAGLLCYLVGLITGIVFYIIEKESSFIRFHALQSIFVFGGLFVLSIVLGMIPILGWFVYILIYPLIIALWILLMVKAYQGKRFKLPLIGNMVEKQLHSSK
ncbi:putative membrane protein [Salirhabdus euzebyi]|uniref:Putative membrane protein n=1 Tax=Salirhabdus euzebyi TaxID=394506 RepID=A0A841PTN6_9BACI|nr:DUF4870 domain-containing protein [Salirhabdus euzebyi]MBB6452347.1 putative membrane protein [Salirhabdus euzebyi]